MPLEDCDTCHYGECILSTGVCKYTRKDGWQDLEDQENECYELQCNESESEWIIGEKPNVTKWKHGTTECREHLCDNRTGIYYQYFKDRISSCNATDKPCHNFVCRNLTVDGDCIPGYESYEEVPGHAEANKSMNACFEVVCLDNKWTVVERHNSTDWKKRSDGCVNYVCDNDTGGQFDNRCWKSEKVTRRCVNHQCITVENTATSPTVLVLFDSVYGDEITKFDWNKDFVRPLEELFGLAGKKYFISTETQLNGEMLAVITLDWGEEELAYAVASAIQEYAGLK